MKAVVYEEYGTPEVLHLTDLPTPTPKDDEILIKIHAVSINGSGRVESVGRNHTEFNAGDELFGELPGYHGGFAEYACTHGKTMMLKPANLTFEQAAAIPQGV